MITFYPPQKGSLFAVVVFRSRRTHGTFSEDVASTFEKHPSRNDDLTLATLVPPRPALCFSISTL
jgi:hypothetical protein